MNKFVMSEIYMRNVFGAVAALKLLIAVNLFGILCSNPLICELGSVSTQNGAHG